MAKKKRWFGVRCYFEHSAIMETTEQPVYEERVTIWHAFGFKKAMRKGMREAREYASGVGAIALDRTDAYLIGDAIDHEVWSAMYMNNLTRSEFVDTLNPPGVRGRTLEADVIFH